MVRALATLTLSVLMLTGAHAQSGPAATSKKATAQASRAAKKAQRATKKAQRTARKTAAKAATATDGWPALENNAPVVASAATDPTYGAGPSEPLYGRDNVYAAPGMPVNVRFSKQAVPYSVRPPRKTARAETTLTNGQ